MIVISVILCQSSPFYRLGNQKQNLERFPKGNGIKDSQKFSGEVVVRQAGKGHEARRAVTRLFALAPTSSNANF